MITPHTHQLAEIGDALAMAGYGSRTDLVRHYAEKIGISASTLYRRLNSAGLLNGADRPREPVHPEYRRWVTIAKQLSLKVPKGVRPVPLWMAMHQAVNDGLVPKAAMDVGVSTFHRIAREMGLQEQPQQTRTLTTTHPMRYCQIDASTSEHFAVVKRLDDGDYLLRLINRTNIDGYKNKPLFKDRLRAVVYSIWDMNTGYQLSRYVPALGENAEDACDFLLWACGSDTKDDRFPFCGVMENLWSDQGPLFKSAASRDLLDRLGINLETGEAYDKTRMGGVEHTHRDRWDWERSYFMRMERGKHFEITLSELNRTLLDYLAEVVNKRASRTHSGISRHDAWVQGVNRMGGVVQIPPDAMATLAFSHRRKVRAGMFQFQYKEYEVDGIGSGEVYVITNQANIPHVVRNLDTGKQHTFRYRGPVMAGEEFRGIAESPRDKLAKKAHDLVGQNPIFGGESLPENVVTIPARSLPAKPLFNPLADETKFATIDEAMAAFASAYSLPLDINLRLIVRELIISKGLDIRYTRDLAANLLQESTTPDLRLVK